MSDETTNDYFLYLLLCLDGSIYTGIAKDVQKRLAQHRRGRGAKYTAAKGVEKLLYWVGPFSKNEALRHEHWLKKQPRKKKEAVANLPSGSLPDFLRLKK